MNCEMHHGVSPFTGPPFINIFKDPSLANQLLFYYRISSLTSWAELDVLVCAFFLKFAWNIAQHSLKGRTSRIGWQVFKCLPQQIALSRKQSLVSRPRELNVVFGTVICSCQRSAAAGQKLCSLLLYLFVSLQVGRARHTDCLGHRRWITIGLESCFMSFQDCWADDQSSGRSPRLGTDRPRTQSWHWRVSLHRRLAAPPSRLRCVGERTGHKTQSSGAFKWCYKSRNALQP